MNSNDQNNSSNYSDIILQIVNDSAGIKTVELSMKIMEMIGPTKFDTEHFFKIIEILREEGSIIELEYVVPQIDYRIKSIYFPKGTDLRITSAGRNESL